MSDPKSTTNDRKTLVEEGTQFKGSLSSNCPIEVRGRIEGDVTAPALSVAVGGAVHGKVKVGEIRSQGELAGEFDADIVQLSGTIKDNTVIRAKSLEVKLSSPTSKMQVIFGECELEVGGQQPSAQAQPDPVGQAADRVAKALSGRPPKTESVPPPDTNGAV